MSQVEEAFMTPTHKWMPVIDAHRCTGCGLCANACGPTCLVMQRDLVVLTVPEACGSEEHCIGLCADDAIHMAWLPWSGDTSRGKWLSSPSPIAFSGNLAYDARPGDCDRGH